MYRILQALKDTYITNKIVNNKFRATDANVGQAGTVDLFKLYDESTLPGTSSNVVELSRALIKFDLDPLRQLTGSILDISHPSFTCEIKLTDVIGGQTVPSNFSLILHPLSKSFDEGVGRDIVSFNDLDRANFITASFANGANVAWTLEGANRDGLLGDSNLDIISSGNLNDGNGVVNLFRTQAFSEGSEDLLIDVTPIISATLANSIPDHGFRIAYSGTLETDNRTLFVKRFASRHSTQFNNRPKLIVRYDDSLRDDTTNFFFDITGSVFLNNYHRGNPANIIEGLAASEVSGLNSIKFKIQSGSFSKVVTGSQYAIGDNFITGVYSASFAISSYDTSIVSGTQTIKNFADKSGSITFDTVWASFSNTDTNPFLSSSLTIKVNERNSFDNTPRRLNVTVTNLRHAYKSNESVRFRVFAADVDNGPLFSKLPIIRPSVIFDSAFYRILDKSSGDIIVPFDDDTTSGQKSATKLSTDSQGMYFDMYMSDLSVGKVYEVQFKINDNGSTQVIEDAGVFFRVDP